MEEITLHSPSKKELKSLNPEGIKIDTSKIKADLKLSDEELVQDTFNTDSLDELNDEGAKIENAE